MYVWPKILHYTGVFNLKVAQFNGLIVICQKPTPCCCGNQNLEILTQNYI